MNTMETNYRNALKDVRKVGIKTRLNVMECCRGCVSNEKLGIENDDVAIIWTYGGQDNATSWHDGLPFSRTELNNLKRNGGWGWRQLERYVNNAENIAFCDLFNHNGLTEQQMQVVYNIFTAHGFVVNWAVEERAYKCIEINYKATYMREQAAVAAQAINTDTYAMC
jgi:hypothetical protein